MKKEEFSIAGSTKNLICLTEDCPGEIDTLGTSPTWPKTSGWHYAPAYCSTCGHPKYIDNLRQSMLHPLLKMARTAIKEGNAN